MHNMYYTHNTLRERNHIERNNENNAYKMKVHVKSIEYIKGLHSII